MTKTPETRKYKPLTSGQLDQVRKMAKDKGVDQDTFQHALDSGVVARMLDQAKIDSTPATLIRVDRSIRPKYPSRIYAVVHPELKNTGPSEYHIGQVEQWLHEDQKKGGGCVTGRTIYAYLRDKDLLKTCLGLRDLEEIRKKGIAFFRQHFQGKAIFGWKSLVRFPLGSLDVPYLCEGGGEVVLRWHWLGDVWRGNDPALRHAS